MMKYVRFISWPRIFLIIKCGGALLLGLLFVWIGWQHYRSYTPDRIHFVLSQSLTMLALDGVDGGTRLDDARRHIQTILNTYPYAQISLSFIAGELVHRVPLTMQSGFVLEQAHSVNPRHLIQARQESLCSVPSYRSGGLVVLLTDGWDKCGYQIFADLRTVVIPVGGSSRPLIQRPDGSSTTQGLPRNDRTLVGLPWATPQTLGGFHTHTVVLSWWWLFVLFLLVIL